MNDLAGKNVLFIAPKFFDYDRDIFRELSRRGASVDLLRDRPFDSAAMVALTRFARFTVMPAVERHYSAELERLGRSHYDLVFVINGQTLPLRLLRTLRTSFANARFVLYMWDSIGNRPSTLRHIHYFDHVFTFDRRDADEYGLKFRPLFYSQDFDLPSSDFFQYDISFIGTAHSDRVKVVSDIDRSLPVNTRCFWHLYLQAPWVLYAYILTNSHFRSADLRHISFASMAKSDVQTIMAGSRGILDIEHPQQRGLTMRTFETIGASKKLVTTNRDVESYDFYHPSNILVVDREAAKIPKCFFECDYVPIEPALKHRYSLAGWIEEILEL